MFYEITQTIDLEVEIPTESDDELNSFTVSKVNPFSSAKERRLPLLIDP
jgi:hypothetical protein